MPDDGELRRDEVLLVDMHAGERDVLRDCLGSVARIAYEDPVERLRWMAALAPALARHGISDDRRDELIGAIAGWLREVDRRDPEAVLGASAAIESIATSGIDPAGALFERAGKARSGGPIDPQTGRRSTGPRKDASSSSVGWSTTRPRGRTVAASRASRTRPLSSAGPPSCDRVGSGRAAGRASGERQASAVTSVLNLAALMCSRGIDVRTDGRVGESAPLGRPPRGVSPDDGYTDEVGAWMLNARPP